MQTCTLGGVCDYSGRRSGEGRVKERDTLPSASPRHSAVQKNKETSREESFMFGRRAVKRKKRQEMAQSVLGMFFNEIWEGVEGGSSDTDISQDGELELNTNNKKEW